MKWNLQKIKKKKILLPFLYIWIPRRQPERSVAQIEGKLLKSDTKRGNVVLIFALVLVKIACYAQGISTASTMKHYHNKGTLSSSLPVPAWDQSPAQVRYFQPNRVGQALQNQLKQSQIPPFWSPVTAQTGKVPKVRKNESAVPVFKGRKRSSKTMLYQSV